jgi:hypothetical protein
MLIDLRSASSDGLWPATWTMGNLGRAGYGGTLDGMWSGQLTCPKRLLARLLTHPFIRQAVHVRQLRVRSHSLLACSYNV